MADGPSIPTPAELIAVSGPGAGALPSLSNNTASLVGFYLIGVSFLLLLTFTLFSLVSPAQNTYVDVFGFLVVPSVLIIGLFVVPAGMIWKYGSIKRQNRNQKVTLRFRFDSGNPHQRRRLVTFMLVSLFVTLPVVAVTSYQGYHYTDSVEFCSKVCHAVMEPQGTAFEHSAHARVACAECHIGAGAGWFVKSKLSGTRQVFKVFLDTYPRPIPPAITELRPARETCEQCHWPAKFFGSQLREIARFSPDENNTRRMLKMLVKTGGSDPRTGRAEGIHMHMALQGRIEYVATDEALQNVPWVRYTDDHGKEWIYRSDGLTAADPRPDGIVRRIDCMDCHNRAAHPFLSPQNATDDYLDVGRLDASLPFIKREAVAVLADEYPDVPTAEKNIRERIPAFYRQHYPDLWTARRADVENAAEIICEIYRFNFFPEMRVDWRTYPDNIGHRESSGCFRCHDGRHINQEGVPISSACETCHTFLNPAGPDGSMLAEGPFYHSMNLVQHGNLRCDQCHTGGVLKLCRDCHSSGDWLDTMGQGTFVPTGP